MRDFDANLHAKASEIARRNKTTLASIVEDAVGKWITQSKRVPTKHDLILYADDESMISLIHSINGIAKNGDWFKAYCGPSSNIIVKNFNKNGWFNATILPYEKISKNIKRYCSQVMKRITDEANGDLVCCLDFILSDMVKRYSLRKAMEIETEYNTSRSKGLMFCPYKIGDLFSTDLKDVMELFEMHDQSYILKQDYIYKIQVTRENIHHLFFN